MLIRHPDRGDMEQIPQRLPIFVYGTMRPGAYKYGLLRNFVERIQPARLEGFQMYDYGDFPGIIEEIGAGKEIVGEVLTIREDRWENCIENLDKHEKNGYLFNRTNQFYATIWKGNIPDEELTLPREHHVLVWVYLVNDKLLAPIKAVKSNDWFNRL